MVRARMAVWLVASALAGRLYAQDSLPGPLRQAEADLDAGHGAEALDLALHYSSDHPRDAHGWLLLGRAYLVSGRVDARAKAVGALQRATGLAPDSPAAWDWLARAGDALGSADGEWFARTASEHVLALDPTFPGAWERWLEVYRDSADRERVLGLLSAHREIPEVRARIARLLIEVGRYAEADTELTALIALEPENPEWLALEAQSAFENGDAAMGFRYYDRAIAHAALDSTNFLWQQVVGIASPAELRAWAAGVGPEARPAFFRRFWARRDPDLFRAHNDRIAEHFGRLRVARREFPLLFPFSRYQRSSIARAVNAAPGYGEELFYYRCEAQQFPGGPTRAEDRSHTPLPTVVPGGVTTAYFPLYPSSALAQAQAAIQAPGAIYIDPESLAFFGPPIAPSFFRNVRDADSAAAAVGYNGRTGLDDRGTTYLRFGPPKQREIGALNARDRFCFVGHDLERWTYDGIGTVRFFRPEAINTGGIAGWATTGDLVFRPMNESQFEAVTASLTEDATSVPAPLSFGVWVAQFAGSDAGQTDVAVISTRGAIAAELVGGRAAPSPPRGDTSGVVVLRSAPGSYLLIAHAQVADTLGRQSLVLGVRPLGGEPGMSDLVLSASWSDTVVTRAAVLARVQRALAFNADATLRSYAELYGLRPGADGRVRYWASYQIYRTDDVGRAAQRQDLPRALVLGFERSRPARAVIPEWLDIVLQRLEPGRYLLRLDIQEPGGGKLIGRAQLGFEIRPGEP